MSQKQNLMIVLPIILTAIVAVGATYGFISAGRSFQMIAQAQEEPITKNIVVSGLGVASTDPDRVTIVFSIMTEGLTASASSTQNAEITNAFMNAMAKEGLTKDDMETVSYTITPIYEYPKDYTTPRLVGYRTEHQIAVIVKSTGQEELAVKAGKVIDAAVSAGVNMVVRINFAVSDEVMEQLKNDALARAVKNASAKAELIAANLNIKVVGVEQVQESSWIIPVPARSYLAADEAKASTQILPGAAQVSASVTVTFLTSEV